MRDFTVLKKISFCLSVAVLFFGRETSYAFEITPVKQLFDIKQEFLQPTDVAVGKEYRIYVMDGVNNLVKVFDSNGVFIFTFGGKGTVQGMFDSPLGISTDSEGRVYVADTGNKRIQIFSPHGKFLSMFPVKQVDTPRPADPVDIAIDDKRERLYVVDNDNHNIKVYSLKDYRLLEQWASEGKRRQELKYPFLITTSNSLVYVVDVLNTRVQAFNPDGVSVSIIGNWGVDLGQLYRPKGVAVDEKGRIFVSDSYVGALQVFNRFGHFKSVVGNENGKVMKWETPVGITIDDRMRLYVVQMFINQVSVYQILDMKLEGRE